MAERIYVAIVLSILLALLTRVAAAIELSSLPESWYQLPEEVSYSEDETRWDLEIEKTSTKAEKRWNRIFSVNGRAFDGIDEPLIQNTRNGFRKWKLANIQLELGLSASGLIGILFAKGSVAAKITYRRKSESRIYSYHDNDSDADLIITNDMTKEMLNEQLEHVISAVVATGKVSNKKSLRDNLAELASEFQILMQAVDSNEACFDTLSKLRLDVSVGASGTVHPGISVGVAVRLRFEWVPVATYVNSQRKFFTERQEVFRRLIQALAYQVSLLDQTGPVNSEYKLNQIRIGIGIFAKFNIGVVKAGLNVDGYAYFTKRKSVHPSNTLEDQFFIPVVEQYPKLMHVRYARRNGIQYKITEGSEFNPKQVVYYFDGNLFNKGLKKAVSISTWIVKRAERNEGQRWEPFKVQPEFTLSLGAGFVLVTVGGTASLQLTYVR